MLLLHRRAPRVECDQIAATRRQALQRIGGAGLALPYNGYAALKAAKIVSAIESAQR